MSKQEINICYLSADDYCMLSLKINGLCSSVASRRRKCGLSSVWICFTQNCVGIYASKEDNRLETKLGVVVGRLENRGERDIGAILKLLGRGFHEYLQRCKRVTKPFLLPNLRRWKKLKSRLIKIFFENFTRLFVMNNVS